MGFGRKSMQTMEAMTKGIKAKVHGYAHVSFKHLIFILLISWEWVTPTSGMVTSVTEALSTLARTRPFTLRFRPSTSFLASTLRLDGCTSKDQWLNSIVVQWSRHIQLQNSYTNIINLFVKTFSKIFSLLFLLKLFMISLLYLFIEFTFHYLSFF